MDHRLDTLDEAITEGAQSPVSGVNSALIAGDAIAHIPKLRVLIELPAYLLVQISWFAAFGMQMVIFPFLLKNELEVSGTLLGLAQTALAAPSVVFILLGGVVAERAEGKTLLTAFHLAAAAPAALLGLFVLEDSLTYWMMLLYALAMGTVGAFMLPARDAILNEIVGRRRASGSQITLHQGVAFATLAQFAAQILGLWIGGQANEETAGPLLWVQGGVVGLGALAAAFLVRGRVVQSQVESPGTVMKDIADGLRCVRRDPVLLCMVLSMFGVGVFVIGAFLVILPIINHDVYHSDAEGLRNIFVTFWAGAFCSSAAIVRLRNPSRPGRFLLIAQFTGSAGILILIGGAPYWAFLSLVFIWGLASGVSIMMSRGIVQAAAPGPLLARVLSIYQLGFMAGAPVGAALMGVIADQAGPHLVALVPSLGMLTMIAWMGFFTPIWSLRPVSASSAGQGDKD